MTSGTESCDVLVVGTGAAGFTAAIAAKKAGLKVLLIEKDELFGGTTAFSGGMIWIPGNKHSMETNAKSGKTDSRAIARDYIRDEGLGLIDDAKVNAYLKYGSEMGSHLKHLRNQLPQTLFLGLAIGSSVEMKEFMRAT